MSAVGERVTGLKETSRALRAFDTEAPKLMRALNLTAAKEIVPLAQARAPIGGSGDEHPGQLYLSIRASSTGFAGYVQAGGGSMEPYAAPIHFGWPGHNIDPHPFLSEAALEGEPAVVRQYRVGIDNLAKRLGL